MNEDLGTEPLIPMVLQRSGIVRALFVWRMHGKPSIRSSRRSVLVLVGVFDCNEYNSGDIKLSGKVASQTVHYLLCRLEVGWPAVAPGITQFFVVKVTFQRCKTLAFPLSTGTVGYALLLLTVF